MAVAFPDVVALLRTYLSPLVTPVPVHSRAPDPRPVEFYQLRRVGGVSVAPVRDTATIDLRAWADSEPRAMELLLDARAQVWALARATLGTVAVYSVSEIAGPSQTADPETGVPMATCVLSLSVRADDVIPSF